MLHLYLWKIRTMSHMAKSIVPVTSHMSNAQGICGTLSKNMSGNGGYFFMSGTLSWTMTITKAVIHVTINKYAKLMKAFQISGGKCDAWPSSDTDAE